MNNPRQIVRMVYRMYAPRGTRVPDGARASVVKRARLAIGQIERGDQDGVVVLARLLSRYAL